MRLFLFECKKILFKKMNFAALLIFTLATILAYQALVYEKNDTIFQHDYVYEDGSIMNREDEINTRTKEKQRWIGTMDEAWWKQLKNANYEASKRYDRHYIDFDKMETEYGSDWYEDYFLNEKNYAYPEYENSAGKRVIYQPDKDVAYTKQDIIDMATLDIYQYGKTMLEKKAWNNEDGSDGVMYNLFDNQAVPSMVYGYNVSKEEIKLLKDVMNEKDLFHYGDSRYLECIIDALEIGGLLLTFWIIMISGTIVNKERKLGMLELSSTCKRGKTPWFIAKFLAVLSSSMLAMTIIVGGLFLYAGWLHGVGDWQVNITESLNLISIFTYGEGLAMAIGMMMLGIVVLTSIAVFISTYVSSSYMSMAMMLLLLFLPSLGFIGSYHNLLPDAMMDVPRSVSAFTISLLGKAWFIWDIRLIIWIPSCILIGVASWKKFISMNYKRI